MMDENRRSLIRTRRDPDDEEIVVSTLLYERASASEQENVDAIRTRIFGGLAVEVGVIEQEFFEKHDGSLGMAEAMRIRNLMREVRDAIQEAAEGL